MGAGQELAHGFQAGCRAAAAAVAAWWAAPAAPAAPELDSTESFTASKSEKGNIMNGGYLSL